MGKLLKICYPIDTSEKVCITETVWESDFSEHTHDFVELFCITNGCGIHKINDKMLKVKTGDVFLIDYGMSHHHIAIKEPFSWINCIFRPEYKSEEFENETSVVSFLQKIIEENYGDFSEKIDLERTFISNDEIVFIFKDMLSEYLKMTNNSDKIIENYLCILLRKIAEEIFLASEGSATSSVDMVTYMVKQLEKSLDSVPDANQIAQKFFVSPSAFSRIFKEKMGLTYREYVTKKRISAACEMLIISELTVGEIQRKVGYSDSKSFFKSFRKYTGMTPKEYRICHR